MSYKMTISECDNCGDTHSRDDMWILKEQIGEDGRTEYIFCSQTCLLSYFESDLMKKIHEKQKEMSELLGWMGY